MTHAASGGSAKKETLLAVQEAMVQAQKNLSSAPTFGLLFVSSKHDLKEALNAAKAAAPLCQIIGCQTAGEFTEHGRTDGGVALLLVSAPQWLAASAAASGASSNFVDVAQKLAAPYAPLKQRAGKQGIGICTTLLLVDGVASTGEKLLKELQKATHMLQPIVGGASGDDGKFKASQVGNSDFSGVDSAVALHVSSPTAWGFGIDHGLRPQTKPMTVTKANGNVLHEIDGKPAFEKYQAYAAQHNFTLTESNTTGYLIANPLGVYFLDEVHHARNPVGVGAKGELKLVADIVEGSKVCILDGDKDSMVAACERACRDALKNLNGAEPAAIVVFDCICRGLILGDDFKREIEAVKRVFPNVPVVGFLTYGEIARVRGKLDGWHNTTTVVVAIPK
jgi:hypothetical protein